MSDAKHTPGPWFAHWMDGEQWPEKRWSVARNDNLGTCICISPRYADHKDLSDAHLIAAAPELLEAVKVCLNAEIERRKKLNDGAPASTYADARISLLRDAIAKAEGRS